MQKEELHILIVDDDATMGKAMAAGLAKAGYKATHVGKPDDAIAFVKFQSVHAAVIDCMLPKMNGRDLASKLRAEGLPSIPMILVSGIYKDKTFIRDAMQATGAVAFITKPFELPKFIATVEDALKNLVDAPLVLLQQFLARADITPKERIWCVDEAEMVHGFDLPWIFSLLLHQKVSGHLNIISADGDVSGVGFSKGEIVQVFQEDTKSYFGELMVEYGFITQGELDDVMKSDGKSKRLGERLVEANLLSPHAVQIVMAEQQGIRLSKTISDTSVKINFIEAEDMRVNIATDRNLFTDLLNEWLVSKFTLDWLKSFYVPWLHHNLKKGPEWTPHHRVLSIPVVRRVPEIARVLLECESLEHGLSAFKEPEELVYRALHALIVSRALRFGEQSTKSDFEAQKKRLTKLLATLDKQNYFERLGVSIKAKESEIKRAYHELAKVLHPDKLPPEAPQDLRELAKKTFERINVAHGTLSDFKLKEKYVTELDRGQAESVLQAEQLAEQARPLLSKGDVRKARELIEEARSLAPPTPDLRLLHCWAKLKSPGAERDLQLHQAVKDDMATVPPEDRHSSMYYFVKGLLLRAQGDYEGSRRNLEHVLSQSPDFIDARRELNILQQVSNKPVNFLSGDLKDVVGMLFKKKK